MQIIFYNCLKFLNSLIVCDFIYVQITGDTQWVDVSTDNYASACLGEAMKMENLTQANATEDGSTGTIFDMIASSTCPKNCSGNGICNNGIFHTKNNHYVKFRSGIIASDTKYPTESK